METDSQGPHLPEVYPYVGPQGTIRAWAGVEYLWQWGLHSPPLGPCWCQRGVEPHVLGNKKMPGQMSVDTQQPSAYDKPYQDDSNLSSIQSPSLLLDCPINHATLLRAGFTDEEWCSASDHSVTKVTTGQTISGAGRQVEGMEQTAYFCTPLHTMGQPSMLLNGVPSFPV